MLPEVVREQRFAEMRSRSPRRRECDCGACKRCKKRAYGQYYRAHGKIRKTPSQSYGAMKTRKWRESRSRWAFWMIGYDGPNPTPQSAWPRIMEHANLYGLKRYGNVLT